MESNMFYKFMSRFYDLLDITYFHRKESSPRKAVCDFIEAKDKKILDVCTGTAANAINIASSNKEAKITGIDRSREMLSIAKQKIRNKGLNNIKLYRMDAADTKFKDGTFDVILISLVLHEIPQEVAEKILAESKRILKPDGKILVVEWEIPESSVAKGLFYPIRKLEPKGFEKFLKMDMTYYYKKQGLKFTKIKYCDFTKVICLKKQPG